MSLTAWAERPLSTQAWVGWVGVALAVLAVAFVAAMRPVESIAGSDVTVYQTYGSKMLDGAVPYRDFRMEYPPAASVMFVLPATRAVAGGSTRDASWAPLNEAGERYYRGFESLVFLLMAAMLGLTALTLRALRRPARTALLSLAIVALSPLLIGQVLTERFDVWPAALTAAALAACVRERYRLGAIILGLGAAAKIYPALLVPLVVIVVIRQRGFREAILVAGAAVGAVAAVVLPFAISSFAGTWESLRIQFSGGLQIESLASSVLVMARHAAEKLTALGLPPPPELTTRGAGGGLIRINLVGPGVGVTTTVMNLLLAATLCVLWVSVIRSRGDPTGGPTSVRRSNCGDHPRARERPLAAVRGLADSARPARGGAQRNSGHSVLRRGSSTHQCLDPGQILRVSKLARSGAHLGSTGAKSCAPRSGRRTPSSCERQSIGASFPSLAA